MTDSERIQQLENNVVRLSNILEQKRHGVGPALLKIAQVLPILIIVLVIGLFFYFSVK